MMTDQEKMQKLFAAALRAGGESETSKLTRAVPTPVTAATGIGPTAAHPVPAAIEPAAPTAAPLLVQPSINAGLDDATGAELAALLDAQNLRKQRKHRRGSLIAALILLGIVGGGCGWFVHSPERVKAFHEAINDIRSVGDIGTIVGKYNKALEKVKARSAQIDESTSVMGSDPTKDGSKDPSFEKEMKEMAGGEGKTIGERNRLMSDKFGAAEKHGGKLGIPAPAAASDSPPPPNH